MLREKFESDTQGGKYTDVFKGRKSISSAFDKIIEFLENPDCQRRLRESELHHDRPALAGVIRELESIEEVKSFFEKMDAHDTVRLRQAVGILVRIIMEINGWTTTGKKGSLGTRVRLQTPSKIPGAYQNTKGSLSIWFTRAERYVPKKESNDYEMWKTFTTLRS